MQRDEAVKRSTRPLLLERTQSPSHRTWLLAHLQQRAQGLRLQVLIAFKALRHPDHFAFERKLGRLRIHASALAFVCFQEAVPLIANTFGFRVACFDVMLRIVALALQLAERQLDASEFRFFGSDVVVQALRGAFRVLDLPQHILAERRDHVQVRLDVLRPRLHLLGLRVQVVCEGDERACVLFECSIGLLKLRQFVLQRLHESGVQHICPRSKITRTHPFPVGDRGECAGIKQAPDDSLSDTDAEPMRRKERSGG